MTSTSNDALNELTRINLYDLTASFGWVDKPVFRKALEGLFKRPAQKFARQMLEFDTCVEQLGLPGASTQMLGKYVRSLSVYGSDQIPVGPVLALSNHPGMVDTLALFTALGRQDLRIIAVHRPFLRSLVNTSNYLDYLEENQANRIALVKKVSTHLRTGGSVLTFPSGQIDPDPAVYPGSVEALDTWMDSVGVFVRLAPETAVLPIVVQGVIWKLTATSPIIRLKRERTDQERLAAALQLLAHISLGLRPLDVVVKIGAPIKATDFPTDEKNAVHNAVLKEMKRLMSSEPASGGIELV